LTDLRINNMLQILQSESLPVKGDDLAKRMGVSNRTLRSIVRSIPKGNSAFRIVLVKGSGYELHILNEPAFTAYMEQLAGQPIHYSASQRTEVILFYLLQKEEYTTIASLEEWLVLSRSTIVKELKTVEEVLKKYNLTLERKAHYGIKVSGEEADVRRAFTNYVLASVWYLDPTKEYKRFMEELNANRLRDILREKLAEHQLTVSDVAFENIIAYLKILAYRASKQNFIRSATFHNQIPARYRDLAQFLISWVGNEYGVSLPKSEEDFFVTHIYAKTSTPELETKMKDELLKNICTVLRKLDSEFLTNFSEDDDLCEALLLHLFPIINRQYQGLNLTDPLIEEIYTEYANIFMVGLRFAHLLEEIYGFSATRDEIGYLTIHIATHFERLKQCLLKNIKRIVVICTTGGGSAHLLRLKLEGIFSRATIITTAQSDLGDLSQDPPNLLLSTIPMGEEYMGIPIIHIKEFLGEEDLQKIKDAVYLRLSVAGTLNLGDFFSEQFFQRTTGDYLDIIQDQAQKMVEAGFAAPDFPQLVLEREDRFTTIYANGIAGPHSMQLNALKNCVGVTILEGKERYKDKNVQLIFLINLMPGHLFLHKEISRLLLHLIDNEATKKKFLNAMDFQQFKRELLKII